MRGYRGILGSILGASASRVTKEVYLSDPLVGTCAADAGP